MKKLRTNLLRVLPATILVAGLSGGLENAAHAELQAGAARVDITPDIHCDSNTGTCPPCVFQWWNSDLEEFKYPEGPCTQSQGNMRLMGYGDRDLEPTLGKRKVWPAETDDEKLFVRAVVLKDDSSATEPPVVIVSSETLRVSRGDRQVMFDRLKAEIPELATLPSSNFLIVGTHTHAGPSDRLTCNPYFDPTKDPSEDNVPPACQPWQWDTQAYSDTRRDAVVTAVTDAIANIQPAKIASTKRDLNARNCPLPNEPGYVPYCRVNRNRQALFGPPAQPPLPPRTCTPGKLCCLDPAHPNDNLETDRGLDVVLVTTTGVPAEPIATLLNYAVHGTTLSENNLYMSGDLPGATMTMLEDQLNASLPGDPAVALWTSGGLGDQMPWNNDHLYEPEQIAEPLVDEAVAAITDILTSGSLDTTVELKGAETADFLLWSKEELQDHPTYLTSIQLTDQLILMGLSMEAFAVTAKAVKDDAQSGVFRYDHAIFVSHANGSQGYLPDEDTWDASSIRDECYEPEANVTKAGPVPVGQSSDDNEALIKDEFGCHILTLRTGNTCFF